MTRDNRKNPEYHVVAAIRKLMLTGTNCPAGKSWPNHVKKEQYIGSEKTYCTCIGVFNCLSTLMEANKIAELFLTTCSHLLFKTYFKPDEFIFFKHSSHFLPHLVIFACLLTRFTISKSEEMELQCTKLFAGVIWTIEYMN